MAKFFSDAKAGLFGSVMIISSMAQRTDNPYWMATIEFLQMMGFVFYSGENNFYWNKAGYQFIFDIADVFSVSQLAARSGHLWPFYIVIGLVMLMLFNVVLVSYEFHKHPLTTTYATNWSTKLLGKSRHLYTLCFLPIFQMLIAVPSCNPELQRDCYKGSTIVLSTFSIIIALLYSQYAFAVSACNFDYTAKSKNREARTHARVNIINMCSRIVLSVGFSLMHVLDFSFFSWALCALVVCCLNYQFFALWFYVPFFKNSTNLFYGGVYALEAWGSWCLLLSKFLEDPESQGAILPFLFVSPIIAASGYLLIQERLSTLKMIGEREYRVFNESPKDMTFSSMWEMESSTRLCLADDNFTTEKAKVFKAMYQQLESKFGVLPQFFIVSSQFSLNYSHNNHLALRSLVKASDMNPFIDQALLISRMSADIRYALTVLETKKSVIQYYEASRHKKLALDQDMKASKLHAEFWRLVSSIARQGIARTALLRLSASMTTLNAEARFNYEKYIQVLGDTATAKDLTYLVNFFDTVGNDPAQAEIYNIRARELHFKKSKWQSSMNDTLDIRDPSNGVVMISGESKTLGQIVEVNSVINELFGYPKEEMVGRNIMMIVPSPFKEVHDIYLHRYLDRGYGSMMNTRRTLVGLHRNGFIFPLTIEVDQYSGDRALRFLAVIRPDLRVLDKCLILDSDLRMINLSANCSIFRGADGVQINDITDWFPEYKEHQVAIETPNGCTMEVYVAGLDEYVVMRFVSVLIMCEGMKYYYLRISDVENRGSNEPSKISDADDKFGCPAGFGGGGKQLEYKKSVDDENDSLLQMSDDEKEQKPVGLSTILTSFTDPSNAHSGDDVRSDTYDHSKPNGAHSHGSNFHAADSRSQISDDPDECSSVIRDEKPDLTSLRLDHEARDGMDEQFEIIPSSVSSPQNQEAADATGNSSVVKQNISFFSAALKTTPFKSNIPKAPGSEINDVISVGPICEPPSLPLYDRLESIAEDKHSNSRTLPPMEELQIFQYSTDDTLKDGIMQNESDENVNVFNVMPRPGAPSTSKNVKPERKGSISRPLNDIVMESALSTNGQFNNDKNKPGLFNFLIPLGAHGGHNSSTASQGSQRSGGKQGASSQASSEASREGKLLRSAISGMTNKSNATVQRLNIVLYVMLFVVLSAGIANYIFIANTNSDYKKNVETADGASKRSVLCMELVFFTQWLLAIKQGLKNMDALPFVKNNMLATASSLHEVDMLMVDDFDLLPTEHQNIYRGMHITTYNLRLDGIYVEKVSLVTAGSSLVANSIFIANLAMNDLDALSPTHPAVFYILANTEDGIREAYENSSRLYVDEKIHALSKFQDVTRILTISLASLFLILYVFLVRPVILEIDEYDNNVYDVLAKISTKVSKRLVRVFTRRVAAFQGEDDVDDDYDDALPMDHANSEGSNESGLVSPTTAKTTTAGLVNALAHRSLSTVLLSWVKKNRYLFQIAAMMFLSLLWFVMYYFFGSVKYKDELRASSVTSYHIGVQSFMMHQASLAVFSYSLQTSMLMNPKVFPWKDLEVLRGPAPQRNISVLSNYDSIQDLLRSASHQHEGVLYGNSEGHRGLISNQGSSRLYDIVFISSCSAFLIEANDPLVYARCDTFNNDVFKKGFSTALLNYFTLIDNLSIKLKDYYSPSGSVAPISYTQKNVDAKSMNLTRFADILVSFHNRLDPILPLSFYNDQHLTEKTQASFDLSFYDTNDPALLKILLFDRMFLKPLSFIIHDLALSNTYSIADEFTFFSLVMLIVLASSQVFFALLVVAPLINKVNMQLFRTNSMLFAVPTDVLLGVEGVGAILDLEFDQPVE